MTPKRVAINGFGRIGRLVFRALVERDMLNGAVEVVAVNDVVDADNLAYLLKYDSVHGQFPLPIRAEGDEIIVNEQQRIKVLSMKVTPDQLPWAAHNIDIVIESTGLFTKKDAASGHKAAGAKKVIISAPSEEDVMTCLVGVNDEQYTGADLVSNASCTTNCLAPLVKVLIDSGIGIEEGLMTTIHAYTASQALVDGTSKKAYRDGRAAAHNVIPASTGAAKMIGLVIPEVAGKLTGMSFRVPVVNVSCVDLTFRSSRDSSLAEINQVMKDASEGKLKGIIGYTEDEVVSSDFNHSTYSSIYDAKAGIELNSRFFKIVAWYDNEWGYSNRMADLLEVVANSMP